MLAGLLLACATTTNVDYREGYDFKAIRSLRLVPPAQPGSADTRINSPLVEERIRKAISEQLRAQGFALVEDGADADLTWQVTTRSGLESDRSGFSLGFGTFSRHSAVGIGYGFPGYDVDSYDEAVLTIDVLDSADGTLLWRGSDSRRLNDGATPESLTEAVQDLVGAVLAKFPPGP
jgi:hypothetical protein